MEGGLAVHKADNLVNTADLNCGLRCSLKQTHDLTPALWCSTELAEVTLSRLPDAMSLSQRPPEGTVDLPLLPPVCCPQSPGLSLVSVVGRKKENLSSRGESCSLFHLEKGQFVDAFISDYSHIKWVQRTEKINSTRLLITVLEAD